MSKHALGRMSPSEVLGSEIEQDGWWIEYAVCTTASGKVFFLFSPNVYLWSLLHKNTTAGSVCLSCIVLLSRLLTS